MEEVVAGQKSANHKTQNADDVANVRTEEILHTERHMNNDGKSSESNVSNKQKKSSWCKQNKMLLFAIGSIVFVTTLATCIWIAILKSNQNKVDQYTNDREVNGIYETMNAQK